MKLRKSPEAMRVGLIQPHGAKPFAPVAGRVMKEYVALPESMIRDSQRLSSWVAKALVYGESLEPKMKRTHSTNSKAKKKK